MPFWGTAICRAVASTGEEDPGKPSFVYGCCFWTKKKVTFWGNNSFSLCEQLLLYGSFCGLTSKLYYFFFQGEAGLQLEKSLLGSVPQLRYPSLLQWTQRSLTYFHVIMRLWACACSLWGQLECCHRLQKEHGRAGFSLVNIRQVLGGTWATDVT